MKITDFVEQEDGSAIVTFEMTSEEAQEFVEYAILDILQKEMKKEMADETNIRSTVSN